VPEIDRLVKFRLGVIRFGLLIAWGVLTALTVVSVRSDGAFEQSEWQPLAAFAVVTLLFTILPWRRLATSGVRDYIVFLAATATLTGLVAVTMLREEEPIAAAFAAVIVFAAATLPSRIPLAMTGIVAIAAYVAALLLLPEDPPRDELVVRTAILALVALMTIVLATGVRRLLRRTEMQLGLLERHEARLTHKEQELDRLYQISRTIGSGSNLSEVLPELVGRVVAAVNAKIGLVMLYVPESEALEVMSPIWVAGHTLRAEGYLLPLTEAGLAQRVFVSGDSSLDNDVEQGPLRDALLEDLDAHQVAAVPLRVEANAIGVLLVADREDDGFGDEDLASLESLAAPAALVLSQMARYEEAKESSERMAELAQLKTDFVSVVSHELRTPLTSILGSLRTLARPELAPQDPNARELLGTALKQTDRLRRLIEDLLVVSRLDNRAIPIRPEAIDVRSFVTDVVRTVGGAEGRTAIEIAPDLTFIEADPEHLRRVITNLIENAVKYSGDSRIEVFLRASGSEVWISVADHGPGIPYELHAHIFDRFTQVDRAETRSRGGTGLGLSIVRGLTEALGGRVWFEPTIRGGATFTVALPRKSSAFTATIEGSE
jgi:signal transduction histidine kinase